jgi:hypothetical protein
MEIAKGVYVFGSNLKGFHGAGTAKKAHQQFGAEWGVGEGRTGDALAIPTKRAPYEPMTLEEFKAAVSRGVGIMRRESHSLFYMPAIGTGLAGFTQKQLEEAVGEAGGLPPNVTRIGW